MNNTLVTISDQQSTIIKNLAGSVGLIGAVVNVYILAVFLLNKWLLKGSTLLVGLTLAHAFNGVVCTIRGFWPDPPPSVLVTPIDCMNRIYPNLFYTTFQLQPLLLALAGIERLLALGAPIWYRANFSQKRQWIMVGGVYVYALISLGINWVVAWMRSNVQISSGCAQSQIFGSSYVMFGTYVPAVLGGLCATVCAGVGIVIGTRRVARMKSVSPSEVARAKKQIRLSKCMFMISTLDVIFVVIPNIALIMLNTGLASFSMLYAAIAAIVYSSDSIWNIFAFIAFNRDFRKVSMTVLRCGKGNVVQATVGGPTVM